MTSTRWRRKNRTRQTGESRSVFLDSTDLERLLEAPTKSDPPTGGRGAPELLKTRDRAILELLFSTGMRVSELANLKKDQINTERGDFTVRGKGDKTRIVFVSHQARHWVKNI